MSDVDEIINFIADIADLPNSVELHADTSLFSNQLLDSVNLVELIAFLEEKSDIRVKPIDITLENFDTINLMLAYIKRQEVAHT